ncbi:MAG: alkaline phosphatase family protein [Candidatus Sumerlaeaceae bacterium]|nr:alkaline phosphatase family protein [Candidatus Sumerlaeaceae bacterium]
MTTQWSFPASWCRLGGALLMLLAATCGRAAGPLNHIMIIWGENKAVDKTLAQPYLGALATSYTQFTNYHGLIHPSQPNYIAFACGELAILGNSGCGNLPNKNLVDLLEAKGVDWREYEEGMTTACLDNEVYKSKHDFVAGFTSVSGDPKRLAKIRGFSGAKPETYAELMGPNPPPVVLVTPNMCNDGHDCGGGQFDAWLRPGSGFTFFQDMLKSKYFTDGAIFITFDENEGPGENIVYCVGVSSLSKPGQIIKKKFNHYSLLRTVEDNFDLGTLTENDAAATNMLGAFRPPAMKH